MAAQYEQIEGMKIHYEVHGSGPSVILLLHGAVGEFWNRLEHLSVRIAS